MLQLPVLTKYYHGVNVSCQLKNLYTETFNRTENSQMVQLDIQYQTSISSFYIDGQSNQSRVIVEEHDDGVNFTCLVDSNPASTIKIVFEGHILKEEHEVKYISVLRNDVSCFHAGVYTCIGRSYGQPARKNVNLFVRCSPRPLRQITKNITSLLGVPVTLTFIALAYPEPGAKGFSWYKENRIRWTPLLGNEDLQISSSGLQSNLTIRNVSSADYGQYRVTVTNSIGSYEEYLFLSEVARALNAPTSITNEENSDNKALIVGLSLGFVCIVLAVYATYLTIRQKRNAINQGLNSLNQTSTQSTYVNLAYKTNVEGIHGEAQRQNDPDGSNIERPLDQYADLTPFTRDDKTTYDILQAK